MPKDVQSADNNKKKLFIKTWGCQMNVYDSRRMADILRPFGYEVSEEAEGADMIILNTCHIREKATDKVFSELGRLRRLKDKKEAAGGKMIMAVAGCVAQAEGEFIVERAPYVDLVFGPQTYHELPEMIAKLTGAYGEDRIVSTELDTQNKFDALPEESNDQGVTAFLSVQEGCDKFCTFCVVPYTRGGEFSRTVQQIVDEAKALIDSGAREITLLGQNVNAFHGEGSDGKPWNLPRIIEELAKLNDLERIRYTTSHPRDMEMSLIEAHRDIEKLMPYLHLPVQSGSNKILKAMNRKHERDMYFEIIEDLRKARPDIALSGDFIVGFPGESDQDFEDTMDLVRRVKYASAYSFKYSPRPGTPAANMANLVREDVKTERLAALQGLINEQQLEFNKNCIGKTLPVLFDRTDKKGDKLHGRTPYNQAIHVSAPARLMGHSANVVIDGAFANSLTGELELQESILKSA
ncbi:MAG: tRNA (N6-isopentenyl adenosine(37)-C2)-methylthiotransferase MiaB [Alphaproteobacteria bacterium]|mgnify:CR=1 FL=1|nr:tRNA (N6-isopentenyl adenosine(37)-C2)-methylthiotransferase MiaB [Alphaproteobacteria bacterium]|tara:strand:- start:6299 stop:7693 length:1395 start_codon:yes stop_codon:yes gene_type:complete